MASPFRTFRKNQKAWMVTLTILTMFAFVFLGSTMRSGSGVGKHEDPEVFTWDYGTVHKSDLENRKQSRRVVKQFLLQSILTSNPDPAIERRLSQILDGRFPTSDEQIVDAMLLEKKAQQLGIVVSDDMVNSFIRSNTGDRLRPEQLAAIVHQMQSRTGQIGQAELFDALRSELAAMYADQTFSSLFGRYNGRNYFFRGDTPGDRWDYFCRLNRKVTAEAMPLPVTSFVGEIPDPSAADLQKFYDQYKNVEPQPAAPTPGFRQPFKAQFQYVKADYEKLLAAEKPKVTEQEIKAYYDEHKDEFKKSNLPDLPSLDEPGSEPGAAKPADKSGAAKSSESKPAQSPSGSKADSKKPDDSKKSDTKKPGDKKSPDGKQSSTIPSGSHRNDSVAHNSLDGELLALADPSATPPAQKSAAAADTKSTDAKPADAKAATPAAPSSKPADSKLPGPPPPDMKAPDAKTPAAQTPAPVEYEPLSKVTDVIRTRLAQQKVDAQVDAAFSAIELNLDQYARSLDTYRAAVTRGNKNAKKPEPPDLAALAKEYGLEAKETDLISQEQAAKQTDVGKSYSLSVVDSAVAAMTGQRYSAQPFLQTAYTLDANSLPTLASYQPQRTVDNDNNRFLWWKTADEAARTPTLDEIKPQVTLAWKIIQARKPALAKAQADADQARKTKQTLKEAFGAVGGSHVSTIGPFTWLTQPIGQPMGLPRLTEVSGIEQAGNDFMKSVFSLKPGETGVATNEPQTVYYVVQVESEEPPLDDLHQEFMAKMSSQMAWVPYAAIGAGENSTLEPAWMKQVKNEYGFQLAPGQTLSDTRPVEE